MTITELHVQKTDEQLIEIADLYWESKSLRVLNSESANREADRRHSEMMRKAETVFGENAAEVFTLFEVLGQ